MAHVHVACQVASVVSDSFQPYGLLCPGTLQARTLQWVVISFSGGDSRWFCIYKNLCYRDDSNKNIPNLHFSRGVIPVYFPIGGYAKLIYPLSFLLFLGRIQVLVLEIYFFRV